jgi:hypothetical protein
MKGSWRRRCDARTKHTAARKAGKLRGISWRCRKWAVPGKTRCYLHGGKSTGPRTPEGKAASLAARLEGRRRRIAQLALEGKKIATGHNGGRYPKDWPPEMRHRTPKVSTLQQIEANSAAWAAEQKALKKELALRRRLLNLVFRGADANIRALAGRGPRDEDLIARAHEAALELQRRWRSDPK